MDTIFAYLADQPVLLLFLLIGVGMIFGHFKIKGVSLGAAAVLFVAIIVSASAQMYGHDALVHPIIGTLGLAIFAFAIGINSGASFFKNLKSALAPIVAMVALYGVAATAAYFVGVKIFGMDIALVAGTFAGATTNTPALAAAGESSGDAATATVGYSIAYIFGVIGMMIFAAIAVHVGKKDTDKPAPVTHRNVRVDRDDHLTLGELLSMMKRPVSVTRIRRGETGPIWIPADTDVLEKDDLLTITGDEEQLASMVALVGHSSSHSLRSDRSYLDFRRITVSKSAIAGMKISELNEVLKEKFGGTCVRVRRGDSDLLAVPDFMIEMGDRIRVVAPTHSMKAISKFLGDSVKGLTDINPVALGLGMMLGIIIGELPILTPTGEYFSIGSAAGTLIVGLIFGRLGKIGPISTSLPNSSASVLAELGLLLFLAQAGTNAGVQISEAFSGGTWVQILLLGMLITLIMAAGLFIVMRYVFKMGGTKVSGLLGGAQTQPAVLAFANARTGTDPRVALGYALVYPVAMIGKILVAQILGSF